MGELWIRTDEVEDVGGSIRHVLRSADFLGEDDQAWKWVALSLHSALQGACVCHLTTSASPIGAVAKRNAVEWISYFDASRTDPNAKPPKTYLMTLPDLLKAVRKPNSAGDRSNSQGIEVNDGELDWLRRFHDNIRNQLTHFEPMGWSVEVSGIPDIAKLVSRIIEDILSAGYGFRHMDKEKARELRGNLKTLKTLRWPIS